MSQATIPIRLTAEIDQALTLAARLYITAQRAGISATSIHRHPHRAGM